MYSIIEAFLGLPDNYASSNVTYLACALTVIVVAVLIDAVVRLFGRFINGGRR